MTATIELPTELKISEGELFSFEGVSEDGKLVVKKLSVHPAPSHPNSIGERAEAARKFLAKWSGSLPPLTDKECDDIRWEALKEKHGL